MLSAESFLTYATNLFFFPLFITIWMLPPFSFVCFKPVDPQPIRSWVAKFVSCFIRLFPDGSKLIFVAVWGTSANRTTTCTQSTRNRSPKLSSNTRANERKLVHVKQGNRHTSPSGFGRSLANNSTTVFEFD